jgi:hypothetical protein
MMDLPTIFDARGAFVELSDEAQAALSDAQRTAYSKIKRCAADLQVADSAVAAAIENIKTCFDAVTEFESFMRKAFPPMTHFDLWKQTVKGT